AAEALADLGEGRADLLHFADMAADGGRLAALVADGLDHRLAALHLAAGDDHMGALLRQQAGNGFADPPAGAGNEGDLAVEVVQVALVHGLFPSSRCRRDQRLEPRIICSAICSSNPFIFTKGAKRASRVWPWW